MTAEIYDFLSLHKIPYLRTDHEAVYTCEQARRAPRPLNGVETKNLFLRDKKGDRHFLLAAEATKDIDLTCFAAALSLSRLSFASAERLQRHLGVGGGAVSLLALINDHSRCVEVLIDEELREAKALLCHPLVNTATLSIAVPDLLRFLELIQHRPRFVVVPAKKREE